MPQGSFYMMYNNNSIKNVVKVGYQSTHKINQIISRYATACGNDITVYMFKIPNFRKMESDFKNKFKEFNTEREFYDAQVFARYCKWCIVYTNNLPEIGDGKLLQGARTRQHTNIKETHRRKPASILKLNKMLQFLNS